MSRRTILRTLAGSLALASVLLCCLTLQAATNLFSTRFERAERYDPLYELIGQNDWMTDSTSYGGNGLTTNFLGSQAAYIGLYPLDPPASYLSIWQPINYLPLQSSNPVVRFSVLLSLVDSTTTNRDDFYWSVYNTNGHCLLTLDFWNGDLHVYYALDDANTLFDTGITFTNEVPYTLNVTMDFARNSWSATLDNRTLVAGQPLTKTGAALNLGDIDVQWLPVDINNPGDNYMIFDNYQVWASINSNTPPLLSGLGRNPNGQFGVRVEGALDTRYAIEATTNLLQWAALRTNSTTNGVFEFRDPATQLTKRLYRARLVK